MRRLVIAAVLAVGVHVALFRIDVPWIRPVISTPHSRAVDISLVTYQSPTEKTRPKKTKNPTPQTETKPKPKPVRASKPIAETVVPLAPLKRLARPQIVPQPLQVPAVPAPEPAGAANPPEEGVSSSSTKKRSPSDDEHAAVRVSVPLYRFNTPAVYPRVARRRNYQGTALLNVRVTAEGKVAEVKLAHSSGHKVLDRSAINAVLKWRFEPARRGSQPIETWVLVPVRFELK